MFASSTYKAKCFNGAALALTLGFGVTLSAQSALAACTDLSQGLQAKICAAAEAAELWQGIESQTVKVSGAHPEMAEALAQDHSNFAALLEAGQNAPTAAITSALQERLSFLNAIAAPPDSHLVGAWQNAAGQVRITENDQNTLNIQIAVTDPINKGATCAIEIEGLGQDNFVALEVAPTEEITLSLAGQSGPLGVDYTRAGRIAQGPSHCGSAPAVGGWYFPLNEGR